MKKIYSIFLAAIFCFTSTSVAFSQTNQAVLQESDDSTTLYVIPAQLIQHDAGSPGIAPCADFVMASYNFSGLNNGYTWHYNYGTAGYNLPKKQVKVTTGLTTTGSTKSVTAGVGTLNYQTGSVNVKGSRTVRLNTHAIISISSWVSNATYHPFITNRTGGTLKGSVTFYGVNNQNVYP